MEPTKVLRFRGAFAFGVLAICVGGWSGFSQFRSASRLPALSPSRLSYEVYAIRYGTLVGFPVWALVQGADTTRRKDLAMMVWLARGNGHNVLVDAGFYREKFVTQWKPVDFVSPAIAVARAGVKPEEVTDIIVSHVHWDHMDGIDLFPKATIWIQRNEYEHYIGPFPGEVRRDIDSTDAVMIKSLYDQGRVKLVDGDAQEIIPGIKVYIGGKHTWESQFATITTASGTVVVASDNMYLFENLEKHAPIAETYDAASNLRAQQRMTTLASNPRLIVPGHDPAVFLRWPRPGNGIAKVE